MKKILILMIFSIAIGFSARAQLTDVNEQIRNMDATKEINDANTVRSAADAITPGVKDVADGLDKRNADMERVMREVNREPQSEHETTERETPEHEAPEQEASDHEVPEHEAPEHDNQ